MNTSLFLVCPTDYLETVINREYEGVNYFYTSLGNTSPNDLNTMETIKDLIKLSDGLNVAQINPVIDPEVDDQALLAEFSEISNILSQLIKHPRVVDMQIDIDFNSADSVAYHLAGLIPIPWTHKQNLLEAYDASQRLNIF